MTDRYEFCLALVQEAGKLALGYFNARDQLTIQNKGPQDLASEADVNTELLIRDRLAKAFPQDAFLGEETPPTEYTAGQGIWVVDPIDGTQPFILGMTSWCVSIGYMQDGIIQFGMVYAPARDELFAGGRNIPATLNGKPIRVSTARSVREGITYAGYSPKSGPHDFLPGFTRLLEKGGMFYRDGSGALMLCDVAAGRLLGYIEPHINSWDCLGAIGVIEAAGLKVNDFLANDGLTKGNVIIAGIPEVYDDLLALSRL